MDGSDNLHISQAMEARIDDEITAQRASSRIDKLTQKNTELKNRLKSMESVIQDFTRQRDEFDKERAESERTIDKLVQEYSDLSGRMEQTEHTDQDRITDLENVIEELKIEKREYQQTIDEMKGKLQTLAESADLVSPSSRQS